MSRLSDVLGENMELLFAEKQLGQLYKLRTVADQNRFEAGFAGSGVRHLGNIDGKLLTLIFVLVLQKSTLHSDRPPGIVTKKSQEADQDGQSHEQGNPRKKPTGRITLVKLAEGV